jgi:dienelactone hydrolase
MSEGDFHARLTRRDFVGFAAGAAAVACGPLPVPRKPRIVLPVGPVLEDEVVQIRLTGLPPGGRVTLKAKSLSWESAATFAASQAGAVDVTRQPSLEGTYRGVDPMGFLWSMVPYGRADPPASEDIELTALVDGEAVATGRLVRTVRAGDVHVQEIDDEGIAGRLFRPDKIEAAPVVVLNGSNGGINVRQAGLLASHGIPALALAYFNYPRMPSVLAEYPLEYFQRAFGWLRGQLDFIKEDVGVLGTSRGGELALLLGATFPEVRSVVAYVPSSVAWGGLGAPGRGAWSYRGVPVPFMVARRTPAGEYAGFMLAMEDAEMVERASIAVEKTNGPILLVSGEADALWPSPIFSDRVVARLARSGFGHRHEHLKYEGAGDAIGAPYLPTARTTVGSNPFSPSFPLGGSPEANAAASADSWPKVVAFFRRPA